MNDDVFRNNIRMISALSFVPIADTIQAFDALIMQVMQNKLYLIILRRIILVSYDAEDAFHLDFLMQCGRLT